jgi:hypothetical protein
MDNPPEIHTAEPFPERKSKFQAFCASSRSIRDVCLFPDTLLENPKVAAAPQNIIAYISRATPDRVRRLTAATSEAFHRL